MKTWSKRDALTSIEEVFLRNIGVSSLDEVNGWFKKSYDDKYRIDRLDDAVFLAYDFIDRPVRIIGDYDGDGVTSTSILKLALEYVGFKNVSYRIPKRFSEGFGINTTIIDEVDSGLIITCDNGVAQPEAIQKAKDKGLTVIIIDHHEPIVEEGKNILPPADVIIDPNAIEGSADFNGYCGAGLSYRFAKKLIAMMPVPRPDMFTFQKKLLALAAIGTVADVMELREENYVFVRNGLKALNSPNESTSGTYALASAFSLAGHVTAHDIGFKLGPAINACSRMKDDGAKDAVNLLTFDESYPKAIPMAETIIAVNDARKAAKEKALEVANKVIIDNCLMGDVPLVVKLEDVPEGVIGIIAGKLCEEYHVPAIVLTRTEDGILRGSSRSCGNYHMKNNLDKCSELLLKYGGHECAAGLSLLEENYDRFIEAIQQTASDFEFEETAADVVYDLEIKASDIPDTIKALKKFEPFGNGNAAPVFKVTNYSINPKGGSFVNKVTSSYDITKLFYKSDVCAIGFDMTNRFEGETPKCVTLVGTLNDNYFGNKVTHQVEFTDFKVEKLDKVMTPLAEKLSKMAMMS